MIGQAGDLARRLARDAEAVCRHYLSNGRRRGHYWIAGDVMNTPGRSLYVRLHGPDYGPGAAGKWTDAATGEHGDLLDLIASTAISTASARPWTRRAAFLALPRPSRTHAPPTIDARPSGSPEAARRLFRAGRPIPGTPAEAYLRARAITARLDWPALRYHPSVYYRETRGRPARNLAGPARRGDRSRRRHHRHSAHLARSTAPGQGAARRSAPGAWAICSATASASASPTDILAAGEGVETMLALKSVLPLLPVSPGSRPTTSPPSICPRRCAASMSLATTTRPVSRRRNRLHERGAAAGIDVRDLVPVHADFNLDLCRLGPAAMLAHLASPARPVRPHAFPALDRAGDARR